MKVTATPCTPSGYAFYDRACSATTTSDAPADAVGEVVIGAMQAISESGRNPLDYKYEVKFDDKG